MASRTELDRRTVVESGSPLGGHSLNQRKLGYERAGAIKVFGKEAEEAGAKVRREALRRERKQVLYDSINNIFQGNPSEEDILSVLMLSDEFEKADPEIPSATIIDFQGLKPSGAYFGEPGFFRRNGDNLGK